MFYLMVAITPVPPWGTQGVLVNHAGTKQDVINFCRDQKLGTAGVRYKIDGPLPTNDPNPVVFMRQFAMPPNADPNAVAAAMGVPRGQQGQNRPDGIPDQMGFSELGDAALPIGSDENMYGDASDGTFTDALSNGQEVMRPRF